MGHVAVHTPSTFRSNLLCSRARRKEPAANPTTRVWMNPTACEDEVTKIILYPSQGMNSLRPVTFIILIQSSFRFLKQNFVFVSYFLYTDNKP